MPSFPKPELEANDLHLNPHSRLEFMLHLFEAEQGLVTVTCDERVALQLGGDQRPPQEDMIKIARKSYETLTIC